MLALAFPPSFPKERAEVTWVGFSCSLLLEVTALKFDCSKCIPPSPQSSTAQGPLGRSLLLEKES